MRYSPFCTRSHKALYDLCFSSCVAPDPSIILLPSLKSFAISLASGDFVNSTLHNVSPTSVLILCASSVLLTFFVSVKWSALQHCLRNNSEPKLQSESTFLSNSSWLRTLPAPASKTTSLAGRSSNMPSLILEESQRSSLPIFTWQSNGSSGFLISKRVLKSCFQEVFASVAAAFDRFLLGSGSTSGTGGTLSSACA